MKIAIFLLTVMSLVSCSTINLVYFANNFEIIAETDGTKPTLSSRILKLREEGECDNGKCPNEVLYIAVSEFGEYPKQMLYVTPKVQDWTFINWEHIPDMGEHDQTLIFNLKSVDAGSEKHHKVEASLSHIKYVTKEIASRSD